MKRRIIAASLCGAMLLSGCTHLEVLRVQQQSDPRSGYAYMLDYTQYELVISRTLAACPDGKIPKIKTEVAITASLAPDGEQLYVIDPNSMISAFKTSNISVDYKDGRLVAFNAGAVDKTGDVIASVAKTGGRLVQLASGLPAFAAAGGAPAQLCSATAVANLKLVKDNKKLIEAQTAVVDEATAKLAVETAMFADTPTTKLGAQIRKRTKVIEAAKKILDDRTKASTEAQAWLTEKQTVTWPHDSRVFHEGPAFPLSVASLDKWFDVALLRSKLALTHDPTVIDGNGILRLKVAGSSGAAQQTGLSVPAFQARYPALVEGLDWAGCTALAACKAEQDAMGIAIVDRALLTEARAAVSLHLVRRGSYGGEAGAMGTDDRRAGLRYRVPAEGTLFVCEGEATCHQGGTDEPVAKFAGAIAQLGTVFNIPFSSPAFASGNVAVTFDDKGRLLKAELKRESAVALGIANAAAGVVDEAGKTATALKGETLADLKDATAIAEARKKLADAELALTKTPAQTAQEELTLLETTQKIEAIRKALGPNRTTELTTEIAIAKLEVDLAEQKKKLQDDPQADLTAVKDQYEAKTAVLNARKASLEAEAAVLEAEQLLAGKKGS